MCLIGLVDVLLREPPRRSALQMVIQSERLLAHPEQLLMAMVVVADRDRAVREWAVWLIYAAHQ